MRALVKSLLAELFPGWVKEEVIQPRRRRMDARRMPARQETSKAAFGRRTGYRANASGPRNGRDGTGRAQR